MEPLHDCLAWARGDDPCGACYVCNMRTWAREMWRVLRDDGVMFLNLGDSYYNYRPGGTSQAKQTLAKHGGAVVESSYKRGTVISGLKEKDLVGIPWRVALALQADGWYLRSDIIWAKPNPMPESVTDRATKSHEYIFMLAKSPRYYFDAEAVKEVSEWQPGMAEDAPRGSFNGKNGDVAFRAIRPARNIRTVWNITTAPYSGAHYAVWPPALVERMVKAGTSERGVCPECGKPWERVVERNEVDQKANEVIKTATVPGLKSGTSADRVRKLSGQTYQYIRGATTGWQPTCAHTDATPTPATVLDPFAGSGTTLMVARQLGRIGLGFDLSETYLRENAAVRLGHDKLMAWNSGRGVPASDDFVDLPLFNIKEDA